VVRLDDLQVILRAERPHERREQVQQRRQPQTRVRRDQHRDATGAGAHRRQLLLVQPGRAGEEGDAARGGKLREGDRRRRAREIDQHIGTRQRVGGPVGRGGRNVKCPPTGQRAEVSAHQRATGSDESGVDRHRRVIGGEGGGEDLPPHPPARARDGEA
jgi:hypothetical protein